MARVAPDDNVVTDTTAVIGVPPEVVNVTVDPLIVLALIGPLKVAVMLAVRLTPVAPLKGTVALTTGGVVVKVHTASEAKGLPAESVTPAAPPLIVPV